nr:MAG TPA: hypothetical protein [Caudoviricetes sp.]
MYHEMMENDVIRCGFRLFRRSPSSLMIII